MPSRVYVGNIPMDSRDRDVERFFKGYGRIKDVIVKNGYAFVEFDERRPPQRDADDAVHDLDGKDMDGRRVRVEFAKEDRRDGGRGGGGRGYGDRDGGRFGGRDGDRDGRRRGLPPGPRTKYRIIVENVSSKTSWQDLKDYFRSAGDVTYANVHHQRQGVGIIEFASRKGLDYAKDHKDELELDGKRLKISEEGGRSRSRSRSDSRGRSRSASRSKSRSRSRSRSRETSRSKATKKVSRSKSRSPSRSRSRSRD